MAKNLFSDGTNNAEKVSNFTTDGKNADGKYPGSYSRNYVFAEGSGADFIYENVSVGVDGNGQFFGTATYKPTAAFLMNPKDNTSIALRTKDDRQVPVAIVNGDPAISAAYAALDTNVDHKEYTSDVKDGFDSTVLLQAYDEVIEHYYIREMACPTSVLRIYGNEELGLDEAKKDYTTASGAVLTYYQWQPASGTKDLPILLTMHGSGNSAEAQVWTSGMNTLASEYQFILVSLENYSNADITNDDIIGLLNQVAAQTGADKSRIYSSGFSMGSMRTWSLAISNASYFAGTINMNAFATQAEDTTIDALLPNYTMGGKESYIAAFEFPSADSHVMEASIFAANDVDQNFTFNPDYLWGRKADNVYSVKEERFADTTTEVSEFKSADGVVYTKFASSSYAGHEPVPAAVEDAWKFVSQFRRTDKGGIALVNTPAPEKKFSDVDSSAYYYDAVNWATDNQITAGKSADLFDPNGHVTRAQIITFLYKTAGKGEVAEAAGFEDVPEDAYYYNAVNWAAAKGITSGRTEKSFAPNAYCTRAEAITFLYKTFGSEGETYAESGFEDVASDAYYHEAVNWAAANKITAGETADTFGPASLCSRAQAITFLYKLAK